MKRVCSIFVTIILVILLTIPFAHANDQDKAISGNFGLDFYAFAVLNVGMMQFDHVYITGFLHRDTVRSIGWKAAYLSDDMDIYLITELSTVICWYRADGHCCTAAFLGDAVK